MSSPILTNKKMMKEKKQIKTKIGIRYEVNEKVGYMKDKTKEGIISIMGKYVVGCVQDVVGKKRLLVQFEYRQKK